MNKRFNCSNCNLYITVQFILPDDIKNMKQRVHIVLVYWYFLQLIIQY